MEILVVTARKSIKPQNWIEWPARGYVLQIFRRRVPFVAPRALAGVSLPLNHKIDGLDIRSVLAGDFDRSLQRDYFLYRSENAIRVGDWKYVKSKKKAELFNLTEDKEESKKLIGKYPEKAEELAKQLAEINAQMKP